jgi:GGDEF domain-containing protein
LKEILKEHNANFFTENSLHLSIGVSTANFGDSLIEILKEADEAMYHQKRA